MAEAAMRRLVFLPGVGADPAFWRRLGDLLPVAWDKTYLGWPGLGDQQADPRINSYDDLIDLVLAAIGDGPVDLLAQSMGGALALKIALAHPDKVRRLVLAVTSGGLDVERLGATDWRPTYRQNHATAPGWVLDTRIDLSPHIPRIAQPTLLLFGDADPIAPPAVGERLAALLPDARLHILPGGDHDLVNHRSAEMAELVLRHLA
ncbi:MAG TPA: alpha/beta fold hydrolase [Caulobacteraceae bacterium]|jgi:pimeloyl-ACP methyl ester carboxylesterase